MINNVYFNYEIYFIYYNIFINYVINRVVNYWNTINNDVLREINVVLLLASQIIFGEKIVKNYKSLYNINKTWVNSALPPII